MEEAGDAVDATVIPFGVLVRWADEQLVNSARVRTVFLHHVVGCDAIPLRLRHHIAVAMNHPLGEERREGLVGRDHARVVEGLHEESRVEQVEDRMLDAAGVLIDRHPVVHLLLVERQRLVLRVGVAQEVPGRVDKGVHGVGLTTRRLAAFRAGGVEEKGRVQQRILAVRPKLDVVREPHRQLVVGHGDDAMVGAIDDRNWHAPVALPRDQPVPEAEGDGAPANAHALSFGADPLDPILDAESAEGP